MDIYTDGACIPNPGNGAWAFVVLDKNNEIEHHSSGVSAQTTNNIMELRAILEAIKYGTENCEGSVFTIYSDSQYALKSASGEFYKLKKNRELIMDIRVAIAYAKANEFEVILEWVRGHNGDPGNEAADYYANLPLK